MSSLKLLSSVKHFSGDLVRYEHESKTLNCTMKFHVFLPPTASSNAKLPVLYFLSGLTCTDENFVQKSGFGRYATEQGVIIVAPDTSPRGLNIDGESASWDFGAGAGFYVDSTQEPWTKGFFMYSYITKELREIVEVNIPVDPARVGIFGHSMGGHGALICALKNPNIYKSVSAFAPICNPTQCPWGEKAFSGYLGADKEQWKAYDATVLGATYDGPHRDILIDQGNADKFLQDQLKPTNFTTAVESNKNISATVRFHDGYDHGYFFISTFVESHIAHHAKILKA